MSHATKKDREEFVAVLTRELSAEPPHQCANLARDLMRLGSTHSCLCVQWCNGPWDKSDEVKLDRVRERIVKLVEPYGIKANCHGDPRGFTVKLLLPSGRYNTWGGKEDGWGVPTS